MFRIWRVHDDVRPVDRERISQVQRMMRSQFPGLASREVDGLAARLRDPYGHRLRYLLLVAEGSKSVVKGFALLAHAMDLGFTYLDYLCAASRLTGGGVGGALYQRVREEALAQGSGGVFLECLPADPGLCAEPELIAQNRARLRFYRRFGALPILGTAYETPLGPDDRCPPSLLYDGLGRDRPLRRAWAKKVVRAILERKYGRRCPPGYIDRVAASFRDDPVRLGPPRSQAEPLPPPPASGRPAPERKILLVVSEGHAIHHVRERGYVEAPARVGAILKELEPTALFERVRADRFSQDHILAVHERGFVSYLRRVCRHLEPTRSIYPYVFPLRNAARPPKELPARAGYYCMDTFTPLNQNAFHAAREAVDCALTAAAALVQGRRLAYALVRPPGHHAERRAFGGFCYFNNAAAAAHYLSGQGPVAVLDLDFHHGNGTQDIFWERGDVFTGSIHGHPNFAYPYFSGFKEEVGGGAGQGKNLNLPLPARVDGARHRRALARLLGAAARFKPSFLVVPLGLDTARRDPTGSWSLTPADFQAMGRMVGSLMLPTLVVQEGGYRISELGANARRFFLGLWQGQGMGEP
jgi:acetoin utilization deacetylase AcuC-like enzyme/GNAT superfamily N-acetyltransferase